MDLVFRQILSVKAKNPIIGERLSPTPIKATLMIVEGHRKYSLKLYSLFHGETYFIGSFESLKLRGGGRDFYGWRVHLPKIQRSYKNNEL